MDRILYIVLGAAIGGFLFQSCGTPELPDFPDVIVPAPRIIEREPPDRPPTIRERIVYRNIAPFQIARAPGGAIEQLISFCKPVTVTTTDTIKVADPQLLLRSGVYSEPSILFPWRRSELRLTGLTNVGDLEERSYHLRGSHDWRASGSSILIREGRFNWVRDAAESAAMLWSIYSVLEAGARVVR